MVEGPKWSDWLAKGEQIGVVEYPQMSAEKINYFVDLGLKKFYFRPGYMMRFALINRSWADFYRKLRGAGNFINYLLVR